MFPLQCAAPSSTLQRRPAPRPLNIYYGSKHLRVCTITVSNKARLVAITGTGAVGPHSRVGLLRCTATKEGRCANVMHAQLKMLYWETVADCSDQL